jgi:hypothetical protein
MPIPFACPHCQLETLVDDAFAGQTGRCAGCNKFITVPLLPPGQPLAQDEIVVGIAQQRPRSAVFLVAAIVAAVLAGAAMLLLLITIFFPAVDSVRSVAQRHVCSQNLRLIAEALAAYEDQHGSLPPAYVADDQGTAMHSWRVLLLPYLGERGLYEQYDFSQPWDSEHNKQLITRMPDVYACPADPDAQVLGESNYMVIVGRGTLFPGAASRSRFQIADSLDTTIAVVETRVQGYPWTQPRDLTSGQMQFVVNGELGNEISSQHAEGAQVVMADGEVRMLTDLIPSDLVQGMTTIQGGEVIPNELLESP